MEFLSTHPSDGRRQQKLIDLLGEANQIYSRAAEQRGLGEAIPLTQVAAAPPASNQPASNQPASNPPSVE
jgi:hypothetical protein